MARGKYRKRREFRPKCEIREDGFMLVGEINSSDIVGQAAWLNLTTVHPGETDTAKLLFAEETIKKEMESGKSKFSILICKREDYLAAWKEMYNADKTLWNDEIYDGVNPSLNKELGTETDNFCVVAKNEEGFPIGLFSFVVTPAKVIGKQFVVNKNYSGRGIGKALLLEAEKILKENGHEKYYIGCSKMSAGILKSFGIEPYDSDEGKDMYKFWVELNRPEWENQYDKYISSKRVKILK